MFYFVGMCELNCRPCFLQHKEKGQSDPKKRINKTEILYMHVDASMHVRTHKYVSSDRKSRDGIRPNYSNGLLINIVLLFILIEHNNFQFWKLFYHRQNDKSLVQFR